MKKLIRTTSNKKNFLNKDSELKRKKVIDIKKE
jgi:hypothetical protein